MEAWVWALIIAALVVVAVLVVLAVRRKGSADELRQRFGPEYDRAVDRAGSRKEAESELHAREERRERLEIRPLDPRAREQYLGAWREVQNRFVDTPESAIRDADALVNDVMRERGYPMEEFEQRAADISVDHPRVVSDYRAANAIARRNSEGEASTEDLRQAMVHYRSLFDSLLGGGHEGDGEAGRTGTRSDTEVG